MFLTTVSLNRHDIIVDTRHCLHQTQCTGNSIFYVFRYKESHSIEPFTKSKFQALDTKRNPNQSIDRLLLKSNIITYTDEGGDVNKNTHKIITVKIK